MLHIIFEDYQKLKFIQQKKKRKNNETVSLSEEADINMPLSDSISGLDTFSNTDDQNNDMQFSIDETNVGQFVLVKHQLTKTKNWCIILVVF